MKPAAAAIVATFLAIAHPAVAQEGGSGGGDPAAHHLSIELNTLAEAEGACRLTMLAENGLGADLSSLVLETVLLTREGLVERLTLFDFQSVPAGRPRVRQFDVAGLACDALGQMLINGVETCAGEGLAEDACAGALELTTRTGVEVIG